MKALARRDDAVAQTFIRALPLKASLMTVLAAQIIPRAERKGGERGFSPARHRGGEYLGRIAGKCIKRIARVTPASGINISTSV